MSNEQGFKVLEELQYGRMSPNILIIMLLIK